MPKFSPLLENYLKLKLPSGVLLTLMDQTLLFSVYRNGCRDRGDRREPIATQP